MTFRLRLIVPVLALAGLAGCQATMSAVVPAGQQAYDEIALTPDEASPEAYQVNAGDKLGIEVYGEPELTRASVTVDEAGDIHLPLIGRVDAAGKSQENLAREIEERRGRQQHGRRHARDRPRLHQPHQRRTPLRWRFHGATAPRTTDDASPRDVIARLASPATP